jgi:hypothetical protein
VGRAAACHAIDLSAGADRIAVARLEIGPPYSPAHRPGSLVTAADVIVNAR